MPIDLSPFVHSTWFDWLNGLSREEFRALLHRLTAEERRTMLLWMCSQPLMEGMSLVDVCNALTREERDSIRSFYENEIAPAAS